MKKRVLAAVWSVLMLMLSAAAFADTLTLNPNGQGNWKKWGNTGCGSGNNEWQCVDETVVNTADYLKEGRTNDKESFTFTDSGLTDETINSVTFHYYAMRHKRSSNSCFSALVRSGGVDYVGPSQMCVGSSWSAVEQVFTNNPATNQPWTVADLDNLEAGMIATNPNSGGRVAQMYVEVTYEPSAIEDACEDSDGGIIALIFGTVSGFFNENPFTYDDYCADADNVVEQSCNGVQATSQTIYCGDDSSTAAYCSGDNVAHDEIDNFCASGACGTSTTTIIEEDCNDADATGAAYCSGDSVMQDTTDGFCSNGGCSTSTNSTLVQDCNNLDNTGAPYCSGNQVVVDNTDGFCSTGACSTSVSTDVVEVCENGCVAGACLPGGNQTNSS